MAFFPNAESNTTLYYFNNLLYDNNNTIAVDGGGTGSVIYAVNNTIISGYVGAAVATSRAGQPCIEKVYVQNNHFITPNGSAESVWRSAVPACTGTPTNAIIDHNIEQTPAQAAAQGYTAANVYAPTAAGSATVGTGANLASLCASEPALCKATTFGVVYDSVNHLVLGPGKAAESRPSTGDWDAGAYQYSINKIADRGVRSVEGPTAQLLWPNPVKAVLLKQYLQMRKDLSVYDMAGKEIQSIGTDGLYLVRENSGQITQRVMVIH
jgi:hypothetical protein